MKITEVKKLMRRNPDSHKGESGHVLLIGGSENYVGALVLAGIAALRSGCDLVTIAAPEKLVSPTCVNVEPLEVFNKSAEVSYHTEPSGVTLGVVAEIIISVPGVFHKPNYATLNH